MRQDSVKGERMCSAAKASNLIEQIAWPIRLTDTKQGVAQRVFRFLMTDRVKGDLEASWTWNRVYDLLRQRSCTRPYEDEVRDLERALAAKQQLKEAKDEYGELVARIARLEALLFQDADFYGAEVDAAREVAGVDHRPLGKR